jgi:hypothetical protein
MFSVVRESSIYRLAMQRLLAYRICPTAKQKKMPLQGKIVILTASRVRWKRIRPPLFSLFVLALCLISPVVGQVDVHHKEGLVHGFLALRTLEGETLADGDLIQDAHGDRVTSRLVFRFKDGSLHDDTATFSQRGSFRLLSDHLVQKGPAFEHPMEMKLNAAAGQVTVRYAEDGKQKTATEHVLLPPNLANGLVLTLLKNISPDAPETKLAFVAATPKPRLVKLVVTPQGEEAFSTGDTHHKALHYVVKVDIGGLPGVFAEILGKKPADTHVWILEGEAPAFVKSEGPLALGGPKWRIELVSPAWPHIADGDKPNHYSH